MPELPEVETIKRDLQRLIRGRKIFSVATDSPKQVKPSIKLLRKAIIGTTIKTIKRRAKLLQIFLANKKILTVHLKLTGRLLVRKKSHPQDDWQHLMINLSGGKQLRFCDLRKFGWVRLISSQKELDKLLSQFGPEPLADFKFEYFRKILANSGRAVKLLLMDQKKISGIGNIYANDALFLAGINPAKPAKKLSEKEAQTLFKAIEKVLRAGIRYRGASDQYYLDALGHKGSYQDYFLVYGREGKKCRKCGGLIKRSKIGGRGTFFCPKCQK
jgi:formamidopyrimidine-DNA glycosylase